MMLNTTDCKHVNIFHHHICLLCRHASRVNFSTKMIQDRFGKENFTLNYTYNITGTGRNIMHVKITGNCISLQHFLYILWLKLIDTYGVCIYIVDSILHCTVQVLDENTFDSHKVINLVLSGKSYLDMRC